MARSANYHLLQRPGGRGMPWRARLLVLVPALYLGVHLFWVVLVYYPRHVVIGYLAVGIVAMYVAATGRAAPPARRLQPARASATMS